VQTALDPGSRPVVPILAHAHDEPEGERVEGRWTRRTEKGGENEWE
jgi:hypothetical protein